MKTKTFILFVLLLTGLSVGLYFLQNEIVTGLSDQFSFYYPVIDIYLFHFLVTLSVFFVIFIFSKIKPDYIRFGFVGMILVKLIAALIFLWPLITMEVSSKIPDLCSFLAPYFLFLSFEVALTIKILGDSYSPSKR